jgi:CubicO group peptidase (beta-lactamase class C family)
MLEAVTALLDDAVSRGDPPSACACVIERGAIVHESAHNAAIDSVFDVASITKIGTALRIAKLLEEGELELDAKVSRYLPWQGEATIRELLGHRSGLPAWRPLFSRVLDEIPELFLGGAPHEAWARARAIMLEQLYATDAGERGQRVYSDLGFMMLGEIAATRTEPLSWPDLGYVDLTRARSWIDGRHVLPTGRSRPREPAPGQEQLFRVPPQPLRDHAGAVDDDNAFALGGVAGHAGWFGTARAIASLGASILERLETSAVLRELAAPDPASGPSRGLGFDHPAPIGSSVGSRFGRRAIGHLGFTGCSLWIDLDRKISAALLTNRTLPGRARVEGIRALRPAFHDALVSE